MCFTGLRPTMSDRHCSVLRSGTRHFHRSVGRKNSSDIREVQILCNLSDVTCWCTVIRMEFMALCLGSAALIMLQFIQPQASYQCSCQQ